MAKYSVPTLEDDLDLTPSAIMVAEGRYLKKDDAKKPIETVADMYRRVAENIAQAEANYGGDIGAFAERAYRMMASGRFLPNSPTIMNAGRELQQLSACYVLPVVDDTEGIFRAAGNGALVHKSGGGTGYDFSRLRPKNDVVKTTKGVSSGPVSFMSAFDVYTDVVKQGGTRRGANMGMLRVDHPDILEFIDCKTAPNEKVKALAAAFSDSPYVQGLVEKLLVENYQLSNFNISVAITDKFMQAYEAGQDYELVHPRTGKVVGKLNAKMVLEKIARNAWTRGDPGVVFIDRMNAANPTHPRYASDSANLPLGVGLIEATNPCGEQPLLPYESCNLGSIDVSRFVKEGKIDYASLEDCVKDAVRFLDDVIDMNHYPLKEIDAVTKSNRKIGLGVMGFADLLAYMGIRYGSHESIVKAEEVMGFIQEKSKEASAKLAEERGSFPNIDNSKYKGKKMRNATTTTIAPTGTISVLAGASSGIEPFYALAFERKTPQFHLFETSRALIDIAKAQGFYSDDLTKRIWEGDGTIRDFKEIPDDVKKLFMTAHELPYEEHLRVQAAFQKHVDNAVSKTINMVNDVTPEDVLKAYLSAYHNGLKGVTVFRNGCRDVQVLTTGGKKPRRKRLQTILVEEALKAPRPERIVGETVAVDTPLTRVFTTVNHDAATGEPYELFAIGGKTGGDVATMLEAIGRLSSGWTKSGATPELIASQLEGLGGRGAVFDHGRKIISVPDGVATAIKIAQAHRDGEQVPNGAVHETEYNDDKGKFPSSKTEMVVSGNICPECGAPLYKDSGCEKCTSCSFNRC